MQFTWSVYRTRGHSIVVCAILRCIFVNDPSLSTLPSALWSPLPRCRARLRRYRTDTPPQHACSRSPLQQQHNVERYPLRAFDQYVVSPADCLWSSGWRGCVCPCRATRVQDQLHEHTSIRAYEHTSTTRMLTCVHACMQCTTSQALRPSQQVPPCVRPAGEGDVSEPPDQRQCLGLGHGQRVGKVSGLQRAGASPILDIAQLSSAQPI